MDRIWSNEETDFLKQNNKNMPATEIALKLNRTVASIYGKRKTIGLAKPLKPIEIGEIFERLIVIEKVGIVNDRNVFLCQCNCGNFSNVIGTNLRRGHTKSCGCLSIEKAKDTRRSDIGESSFNNFEYSYIRSAKTRDNIEYSLLREEFRFLVVQNCFWCGENPKPYNRYFNTDGTRNTSNTSDEWAEQQWINVNGIDRLDNEKGYTINNCVPCCTDCNEMKMDRVEEEFISQVYKIVAHQESKKQK